MSDVVSVLGGTGALGRGLALRLARHGRPVVLGSRDAARAEATAGDLRAALAGTGVEPHVDGASNAEAASAGEVVLLATPWDETGESIAALAPVLAGRLVVSCINPLGFDARGPHGLQVAEGSAAEQIAALLPDSTVTAGFHHLSAPSLANLDKDLSGEDVLVCGDDADARTRIVHLAAEVTGRPGVDVGALRQARVLEPFTAVLIAVNRRYKTRAGVLLTHVDLTTNSSRMNRPAACPAGAGAPIWALDDVAAATAVHPRVGRDRRPSGARPTPRRTQLPCVGFLPREPMRGAGSAGFSLRGGRRRGSPESQRRSGWGWLTPRYEAGRWRASALSPCSCGPWLPSFGGTSTRSGRLPGRIACVRSIHPEERAHRRCAVPGWPPASR